MTPDNVLEYWFGDLMNPRPRPGVWFEDAAKYDDNIRDQFGALLVEAHAGKLDYWAKTPRGRLALALRLTFASGRIAGIDVVADQAQLREMDFAAFGE